MNKREKALEIRKFLLDMIEDCRKEARELTPDEQKLFDEQKNELIAVAEELKKSEDVLKELEDTIPEIEAAAEKPSEEEEQPAEEPGQPAEEQPAEEPEQKPEEPAAEEEKPAEEPAEEPSEEPEAEPEKPSDEPEKPADDEKINKDETPSDPKDDEDKNKRNSEHKFMEFSLLKTIRSAAFNQPYDEASKAVLEEGLKDFRSAGRNITGQIQLPTEKRTITVATEHDDVVQMEWQSLIKPLFENKVLGNAKHITGLRGDIVYPTVDKTNPGALWEGEITKNTESTNLFGKKGMSPHRLSTTIYVSKQFLMQESIGAEQAIRELLIESLAQKLEKTFLGKGAADNSNGKNIPAGLFYGKEATYVKNFAELCEFEAQAVENCYNLDSMKYLLDPKSWANIRGTFTYGGKNTRMVMEGKEIDGRAYDISQNFGAKEFALIDWSNVVIGEWGGMELSVDANSVEMARTAQVAITVNAWFDAILTRDDAVLLGTVAASTIDPSTND
jgi:HK97 family phage major capsid protein